MSTELYFTDPWPRAAATHLLDSPFGQRLREVATVTEDDRYLQVTYHPTAARMALSSGELILLSFLESMVYTRGCEFAVCDLSQIDDTEWDRVIACLFMLRGRALDAQAVSA